MNGKYYYDIVAKANQDISWHPGIKSISNLALKSRSILDVGCGDGSKLFKILGKNKVGTGIDVNRYAIKKAKTRYPHLKFLLTKGDNIPFSSNSFDLVYSTFVLEHTLDQELFVKEMIRVTKKEGHVVILCPNYGSPNRRSPVSLEKPVLKLMKGLFTDFFPSANSGLIFTSVKPRKTFKNPDDDTTCEPYLLKLKRFLNQFPKIKIEKLTSLWEIDDNADSSHQKLFKFIGQKGIFPFNYWGPQLFIVLRKI